MVRCFNLGGRIWQSRQVQVCPIGRKFQAALFIKELVPANLAPVARFLRTQVWAKVLFYRSLVDAQVITFQAVWVALIRSQTIVAVIGQFFWQGQVQAKGWQEAGFFRAWEVSCYSNLAPSIDFIGHG